MMTIKKLEKMPYAQAHIEIDENGNIYLFSYTTLVAQIVNDWLTVFGLYSMTTRKHISAFMSEFTPCDYYTARKLYEDNYKMDITTGECLPVAD